MLLYAFLRFNFAEAACVGSNQFMYWNPNDPNSWVSPDGFVCFCGPDWRFDSWKIWEQGIPEVAVEIIDSIDFPPGWVAPKPWDVRLASYSRIGVRELVRFEPDAVQPLRVWDRVADALVERELERSCAYSPSLRGYWLVIDDPDDGPTLRLSRDERGMELFLTATEDASRRADLAVIRASCVPRRAAICRNGQ